VTTYTQALYEARELAMARMQAEAEQLDAEGIVGVRLKNLAQTGPGTPPSSSRSEPLFGHCVTITRLPNRQWSYR
jgi:hypothetical protein